MKHLDNRHIQHPFNVYSSGVQKRLCSLFSDSNFEGIDFFSDSLWIIGWGKDVSLGSMVNRTSAAVIRFLEVRVSIVLIVEKVGADG